MDILNIKKLLAKLVAIPSVSSKEKELAEFLERKLKKNGYKVQRQKLTKDRFNVLGETGQGFPCILFYGHIDTVAPAEDWQSNPFKLKTVNGLAYGLGACDMKGGLVTILHALQNFKPKNFRIKVAFCVDEENISEGANLLINSGWLNDVNFIIVPEATPSEDSKKQQKIILGRRGRVDIKIIVKGKAVHAALPNKGLNAIEEASRIILALKKLPMLKHKKLGKGSVCPMTIKSKAKGLSVPEQAEIIIDRHLVPPETKKSVVKQLKQLIKSFNLKSKVQVELVKRDTPFLMPYLTKKENHFIKILSRTIREKNKKVIYGYGASVADENYFGSRLHLPVAVIGPTGGNSHSANEWISLQSVRDVTEIFLEFLQKIDKSI